MRYKIRWILVVLWMALIFGFSSQPAEESSKLSDGITERIVAVFIPESQALTGEYRDALIEQVSFWVRKAAHATVYFILAVLIYWAVGTQVSNKKRVWLTLGMCLAYAISDEIHQYFVPGRSNEIRDVMIDFAGSCGGVGVVLLINKCINTRKIG